MRPPVSIQALQQMVSAETSTASRVVHAAVLLGALAVAGLVSSLWITEPALPPRTHAAFAAVVTVALVWVVVAARALRTRRALFARQRVTVAWLALAISAALVIGTGLAASAGAIGEAAPLAGGFAIAMLAGSAAFLVLARRRAAELGRRRASLERELEEQRRASAEARQ